MQNSFLQVVWTEMFVGSVCTQPPYNDKNPPSVFFLNHNPFLRSSYSQILVSVTSHRPSPLPRLLIDSGVLSQTRPEWAFISPPLFRHQSRCRQVCLLSNWGVLLLDVIMNIAVVIYSRYLRCWRRSGLLLFLKGMCPDLPKCKLFVIRRSECKVFVLWIFANRLS